MIGIVTAYQKGLENPMSENKERGAAYLLILTMIVAICLVFAAIVPFSMSHYRLAAVDETSADAFYLAEAGINYELNKMNRSSVSGAYPPEHDAQPKTITMGSDRSFMVSATEAGYGAFMIESTGKSAETERTIRTEVQGQTVFDGGPEGGWTAYGANSFTVEDGWTVGNSYPAGTAGNADIDDDATMNSAFYLIGSAARANSPFDRSRRLPGEKYPAVDSLANSLLSALTGTAMSGLQGLLSLLSTEHNDNENIVNSNGQQVNIPSFNITDGVFSNLPKDASGLARLILRNPSNDGRAANFYIEGLDVSGATNLLEIDNRKGPVNLWIGRWSLMLSPPALNLRAKTLRLAVEDHSTFRVYLAATDRPLAIELNGQRELHANVYAVNRTLLGGLGGTVKLSGKGLMIGSVMAHNLNLLAVGDDGGQARISCPTVIGRKARARRGEPIGFFTRTPAQAEVQ